LLIRVESERVFESGPGRVAIPRDGCVLFPGDQVVAPGAAEEVVA
jgi:hypothetical protein